MRTLFVTVCGVVLVASVSGCGSSGDSLMKDQIALMNELADALENGADQSKVEALTKKSTENGEKLKALNLSEAEMNKLGERYKDELAKATTRLANAMMKGMSKQVGEVKLPDLKSMLAKEALKNTGRRTGRK
jgi:hypothetical protein